MLAGSPIPDSSEALARNSRLVLAEGDLVGECTLGAGSRGETIVGVEKNWRARDVVAVGSFVIVAGACEGKHHEFGPAIENDNTFLQPVEAGASSSGGIGSGRDGGAQPSAGGSVGEGGLCDQNGNCRCNAEAESCAPIPLCDDGGSSCESTCPGCLIDQECFAADAFNPDNLCQTCDPSRDAGAWSNNDGVTCDDDQFCTIDDSCNEGRCNGTVRVCEDGVACNGTSECNEDSDTCSPAINQCPDSALCNAASDTCVNSCGGCTIAGVCLSERAEQAGNPCMVCDPSRSVTDYSPAVEKPCGAGPSTCSQQDTCDAQGVCQPNHLPANSACGDSSSRSCDQSDACNGNGVCEPRNVPNGMACDDGAFCRQGDQCQGGECIATSNRNCGANRTCNEATDQCQCQGCVIGNSCVVSGTVSASNTCEVCDPVRNANGFSTNVCPVACPADSVCRTFTPPQAGACDSSGQCAECGAVNTRAGVLCDPGRACDGAGDCVEDLSGLVAAGPLHTCAITRTGGVRCWGLNGTTGVLGYGHTQDIGDDETPLQAANSGLGGDLEFGNGRRAVQVTAGTGHSCALFDNGTVRCWAVSNPTVAGTSDIVISPAGIVLPDEVGDADLAGQRALQISTGSAYTCAVLENGTLRCWGVSRTTEELALAFGGLRTNRVSLAGTGACAVLQGGILRCWGNGPEPTQNISTGGEVVAASTGGGNACAVLASGALRCWGVNGSGELGLGHTRFVPFNAPLADSLVDVGGQVRQLAMSVLGTTCVILQNGSFRCWGFNGSLGQLGYRHTQNIGDIQTPAQAAQPGGLGGSLDFGQGRNVLVPYGGRCALLDDRQLFCWGVNSYGEQGNPTFFPNGTGARTPADVGPVQFQ